MKYLHIFVFIGFVTVLYIVFSKHTNNYLEGNSQRSSWNSEALKNIESAKLQLERDGHFTKTIGLFDGVFKTRERITGTNEIKDLTKQNVVFGDANIYNLDPRELLYPAGKRLLTLYDKALKARDLPSILTGTSCPNLIDQQNRKGQQSKIENHDSSAVAGAIVDKIGQGASNAWEQTKSGGDQAVSSTKSFFGVK